MKRSKFSLLRFLLLSTLAGIFIYSASVQEIHYLFVNHHTELNEHCHNHLHAQTGHADCNLCKIELGSYVQPLIQPHFVVEPFLTDCRVYNTQDVKINYELSSVSPRGPPALA